MEKCSKIKVYKMRRGECMVWVISGVIFVLLFIFLSRIYIECNYVYRQKEQHLFITVSIYHIRLIKKEMNLSKINTDTTLLNNISADRFITKIKEVIHGLKSSGSAANILLEKLRFHQFNWSTEIGAGEAGTTGIICGVLWTVKGVLMGLITNKCSLKCNPDIRVVPLFQHKYIHSKMDCIVSIRLAQAIYAFLKVMRLFSIKSKAFI